MRHEGFVIARCRRRERHGQHAEQLRRVSIEPHHAGDVGGGQECLRGARPSVDRDTRTRCGCARNPASNASSCRAWRTETFATHGIGFAAREVLVDHVLEVTGVLGAEDQFGRHHRVQHHGARAVWVPAQVLERNPRPVRNAHEVVPRYAERRADRLEVCDVIAGRIEARIRRRLQLTRHRSASARAAPGSTGSAVSTASAPGQSRGLRSPGAALVDQDHVALAQHAMKRGRDLRKSLAGRIAPDRRPASRPDRSRAACPTPRCGHPAGRLDAPTVGPAAVLRHSQRAALCRHRGRQPRLGKRARLERDRARRRDTAVVVAGGAAYAGISAAHKASKRQRPGKVMRL